MSPVIKNILAVIAGIVIGSAVNMGIIIAGSSIIPPPEGIDIMDPESIKAMMHLFQPRHFISPFLAHALGTMIGAALASLIAPGSKMKFAIGIGVFFLAGGIYNAAVLPAPAWFIVLDLVFAYLPMGWLGWKISGGK